MNLRLFVALECPEPVRRRLGALQEEMRRSAGRAGAEVRWIPSESLHLTLQFLGAVPEERVEAVRAAVARGTAVLTNYPQVAIAGKTGTAEYQGQKDTEGHWPTHAWFVGFAPADNPQIALVVFVEGGGNGAEVAVPIAAKILGYYFKLPPLEVPK